MRSDDSLSIENSEDITNVIVRIREFVNSLDERNFRIFDMRLRSIDPMTLDAIGAEFSVTRERVRQLESILVKKLMEVGVLELIDFLDFPKQDYFVWHIDMINEKIPASLRYSVLEIKGYLVATGSIERSSEKWISKGMLNAPKGKASRLELFLRKLVAGIDADEFQREVYSWNLPVRFHDSWLEENELIRFGGKVLHRSMSAYTFLETLLEAHGSPLDIFLIFQEAGDRWSQQTLTNALQGDPRFVRTDKSRYGLSKWGLEKYEGISNEIRKIIEADGPMHIDQIVQRLTLWFDVEESSVRSYALDAPFEQINGIVALKAPDAIKAPTFQSLLPRQIVDITQHSGGFDWVLKINADHLRGSGFNAKIAIASILGMFSGETVSLTINETEHFMKVYWTKKQPFIGSIKAPLVLLGAKEGDKLRIRFNGNEGKIENADFSLIP